MESFIHNIWSHETVDPYLKKFTFKCNKLILVGQVFHVLLTVECSLTYMSIKIVCLPSFSRHKLKLLSKCCVIKVRQYIYPVCNVFILRVLMYPKNTSREDRAADFIPPLPTLARNIL